MGLILARLVFELTRPCVLRRKPTDPTVGRVNMRVTGMVIEGCFMGGGRWSGGAYKDV